MTAVSAAQVRRDAVQRLIDLAADGDHEMYAVDAIADRRTSLALLQRRVLDRRRHDISAMAELEVIWPLVSGDTAALIDAVAAGGLDPTAPPPPSADDVAAALARWETS